MPTALNDLSSKCRSALRIAKWMLPTVLLLSATLPPASAADCENGCLPPVTVTGLRIWGDVMIYDSSYVTALASEIAAQYQPWRGPMAWDDYFNFLEEVRLAKLNPLKSPDVRCNPLAAEDTRQTTSATDGSSRFVAADQLFTAIVGAHGFLGMRTILKESVMVLHGGKKKPTWTVTFADGGKETYIVAALSSPTLIVDTSINFQPGDGIKKPCPNAPNA